jgi:hypothetical protein|tara:strand:- start:172 stop:594 length:423 start_codon:yes stop_codon:yes gene_type:complete
VKPESKFWKQVKENLNDINWTRLENRIGQGVPDVYGIKDGTSIWIELKVITSNRIKLSPFQKSWNFSHSLQGGRNFIMATAFPQSLLYIFSGIVAPSIGSIANLPPDHWVVDMVHDPQPWQQVRDILLHCPLPTNVSLSV